MPDHLLSRLAMNVGDERGQFNIGILEKLLGAVDLRGLLLNQFLPIAGQLPRFTDGFGWNETPLDETVAKKLGNPLTILDVGFPTWDIFDISGIGQNHFQALFQDAEDRFPVDSGTFQDNMGASLTFKSILTGQKVSGHGGKRFNDLFGFLMRFTNHEAGGNGFLVDINPTTPFKNGFHRKSPFWKEGRSWLKNLTRVLPMGTTIRGTSDQRRSVWTSVYDH